jgi:glycosyltransferase involved in cell wall biosynthesis
MKVSIITAVLNNKANITDTLASVARQSFRDIEHILIDGGSVDGTLEIIQRYPARLARILSEPDTGLYDALNKGIRLSSGEVIGFLHGGDLYAHENVVKRVVEVLEGKNVDSCYGDLQYVEKDNIHKVIRYWRASEYQPGKFKSGWMPPHPTFFVKTKIYEKFQCFNTKFRIAADYELMLRFLEINGVSTHYIPEVLIKMRAGGMSNRNLRNIFWKSYEDYKAWKVNHLKGGLSTIFLKNLSKLPQFFIKA